MHSDRIAENEIRRFEEQYAENPESFVFARLADAYRKVGNAETALKILEHGLERHPDYLSAHIVHARSLSDLGRDDEAVAAWGNVLELDQQNLVALRELSELALARGDRETARVWAERLLLIDPLNEEAARLAVETAPEAPPGREGGGSPESPEDAAESGTLGEGMVTETMADLYLQQGLYEEAAEIYWELVKRQPADPRLRERLAKAQALSSGEQPAEERSVLPLGAEASKDRPLEQPAPAEAEPPARAAADPLPPSSAEPSPRPPSESSEPVESGAEAAERPQDPSSERPYSPEPAAGAPTVGESVEQVESAPDATPSGIRAHLRALIGGSAVFDPREHPPVQDEQQTREERADSTEPRDEGSVSGFGEWLRRRRR